VSQVKYQLVLQLPASSIRDYDALIELEDAIIKGLGHLGKVDGHDVGSGEMNIFILTDEPSFAFEHIKKILGTKDFMIDLKVAFRIIGKDDFTILHPADLVHFTIL
jgi:hypothetical protein